MEGGRGCETAWLEGGGSMAPFSTRRKEIDNKFKLRKVSFLWLVIIIGCSGWDWNIPQTRLLLDLDCFELQLQCDNSSPMPGGSEFHDSDLHLLEGAVEHEPEKVTDI